MVGKRIASRTPTTAKTVALFVTENATTVNGGGGLVSTQNTSSTQLSTAFAYLAGVTKV